MQLLTHASQALLACDKSLLAHRSLWNRTLVRHGWSCAETVSCSLKALECTIFSRQWRMHELVYGATEVDGRLLGVILVGVALKLPEPHMQASAGMPQMLCEKVSVIRALHSVRPSEMSAFIFK